MKLFWYTSNNFGDALNLWLWPKVFGKSLQSLYSPQDLFLGIGTILSNNLQDYPFCKIVLGSGYGYGLPPVIDKSWKIYALRGPLTANALSLETSLAITDPAILCSSYVKPPLARKKISLMLHHNTACKESWRLIATRLGISFIDPTDSVDTVIQQINSSKMVIAEAMHGAIISDSLRIPWIPIKTSKHINNFKWMDWASSINLQFDLTPLPCIQNTGKKKYIYDSQMAVATLLLGRLMNHKPYLSSTNIFLNRKDQMLNAVYRLLDKQSA